MAEQTRDSREVLAADPKKGLTGQQVQQRLSGGWGNQVTQSHTQTEGQIIRKNCLTFFNFLFLFLNQNILFLFCFFFFFFIIFIT